MTGCWIFNTTSGAIFTNINVEAVITGVAIATIAALVQVFVINNMKQHINKKLDAAENKKTSRDNYQHRYNMAASDLRRAQGRFNFWAYRGITKPPPNGELDDAMSAYNEAEETYKRIEREIIADFESKH